MPQTTEHPSTFQGNVAPTNDQNLGRAALSLRNRQKLWGPEQRIARHAQRRISRIAQGGEGRHRASTNGKQHVVRRHPLGPQVASTPARSANIQTQTQIQIQTAL